MNVCVFGLWHLGSVTSACIAQHFKTVGTDPNATIVENLKLGKPPLYEPGLGELIAAGLASGNLTYTSDLAAAVGSADVVWVAFDTDVNDRDEADIAALEASILSTFPYLKPNTRVVVSSQASAGFSERIRTLYAKQFPGANGVRFICSPENLRLGTAIALFSRPERIAAGTDDGKPDPVVAELLAPLSDNVLWMSAVSAEMTKHTINAYLATTLSFINEIAAVCESVGADAKDVERGLRSDSRAGNKAYLSPGAGFAGGTLARDIAFLRAIGESSHVPIPVLSSIQESNDVAKSWPQRTLERQARSLRGKRIVVLGLTYKPGTDTLRRSSSVELAQWIASQGATVIAFDPVVKSLPTELADQIQLSPSVEDAVTGADALVVATEWPEFTSIDPDMIVARMNDPLVIDVKRFLGPVFEPKPAIRYFAAGKSSAAPAPVSP